MEVGSQNGMVKNQARRMDKPKDPELEAEIVYAKENGYEPPKSLCGSVERKSGDFVDYDGNVIDIKLIKGLKNGRAERKARSRGVSGCSIKKDGNRFEYGLDVIDLDDNVIISDHDSTDEELDEYADYIVKYSETEIREIVEEYFSNGRLDDSLVNSLRKFCFNIDTSSRLIKDLIIFSTEHGPCEGIELGIKLIIEIISRDFIDKDLLVDTLEELVNSLDDLMKDVSPRICDTLSVFMAKLVEHEVWDDKIIKLLAGKNIGRGNRIEKCYADALALAKNHYLLNLECPPVGPFESTKTMSSQFKMVLTAYIQNQDKLAASKRLTDLKVPHFNHEFVYQTGTIALEKMNDNLMKSFAELLKEMVDNEVITMTCISKGFDRLYNELPDLFLDLPAAYVLALRWTDKCLKEGFISKEIADKCPRAPRTRTRTLSKGIDGKLSCTVDDSNDLSSTREFHGH